MGGAGSGRWESHWKKTVVEACLKLSTKDLRHALQWPGTTGILKWNSQATAEHTVENTDNGLRLILRYQFTGYSETIFKNPVIPISSTDCNYGGQRHWLHCPQCQRRSAVLYLLNGDFACRQCHDLTYTSAQQAHKSERLLQKLDAMLCNSDVFL